VTLCGGDDVVYGRGNGSKEVADGYLSAVVDLELCGGVRGFLRVAGSDACAGTSGSGP
jgi:hypothetical protein